MTTTIYPKIDFSEVDAQMEFNMPLKGWFCVDVELANQQQYYLCFVDPVRLQQDLAEETLSGRPFFAEPGLVILNKVALEEIRKAVQLLWEEGYFEKIRPQD